MLFPQYIIYNIGRKVLFMKIRSVQFALQKLKDLFPMVDHKFMLKTVPVKYGDSVGNDAQRVARGDPGDIGIQNPGFPCLNIERMGAEGHAAFVKKNVAANSLRPAKIVGCDFGVGVVVHVIFPFV